MDEIILFETVTVGMLIAFGLGLVSMLTYALKKSGSKNPYMCLNLKNILFHFVASFAVLYLLNEASQLIIDNYIPSLKGNGTYNNTLSFLTGMFGSVLIAWVLEGGKKKLRIKNDGKDAA